MLVYGTDLLFPAGVGTGGVMGSETGGFVGP